MVRIFTRSLIILILAFALSGCDFYTLYFLKKTLDNDFNFIKKTENKYKLKGESYYDIPVSEEEKITPEFTKDKLSLLEDEKDLFPLSQEKVSEVSNLFVSKGDKINISLPTPIEGTWVIKKYPIKVAELIPNQKPVNTFSFSINSTGEDNVIFQLINKKGNIVSTVEYKIISSKDSTSSTEETIPAKKENNNKTTKKENFSKTNLPLLSTNLTNNQSSKPKINDFDVIDEEKNTNIIEPKPPAAPGKLDIKSLVGDEKKFFENIDNIAKKYGYYRALREIESLETNVSETDLPKLKLKKIEYLEKLGKYTDALKEAEAISSKEPFGKLYVGIFLGTIGKNELSEKNIKEALNLITTPLKTKSALSKVLDFYLSNEEPPTKEMVNFLLQRNELIQKDFKKDYLLNLISIGNLYERVGEFYKAKSLYNFVINSGEEEARNIAETNINNLNKILDYK